VDRLGSYAQVSPQDLQQMTSFWNPEQAHRNIKERFAKGASLWLIRREDKLAGYGWTLQGRTIEPYYLPLAQDDVHLFDFHVFPQYRGRGINPLLISSILRNLALNCRGRAFIEAAEWNQSQLTSLQKTPFCRLGLACSFTIFGRTFVSWSKKETKQLQICAEQRDRALTMARPHE
jgi:GNAT superfamily N-acetyltransferase